MNLSHWLDGDNDDDVFSNLYPNPNLGLGLKLILNGTYAESLLLFSR